MQAKDMTNKMNIKSWSEIDVKAPNYYEKIISLSHKPNKNIVFLVVDHCLQTFESHVNSLSKLGKIAGVILKSSTRLDEAEKFAQKYCKVLGATKESLRNSEIAIKTILENTTADEKLIILDHGGYFAPSLKDMMNNKLVQERLIGIVEVTENGHHKYEKALISTPIPLLSIARTAIKELEDMQVGVSICDAANTIMYSVHAALDSLQNACVLGYGKIGRSIANSLNKRGISEITVIEIDPLRAQLAIKEGHNVIMANDLQGKMAVYQKAQIIFSATGSKALTKADIAYLRKNEGPEKSVTYIASCTSPDDEFNSNFIPELATISTNSNEDRLSCESKFKLSPYKLYDGRQVIILNGGKAVNFAIGGSPGYEICQVWGAILFSATKLATQKIEKSYAVQTITRDEQVAISNITLTSFFSKQKEELRKNTIEVKQHVRRHSFSSFLGVSSPKSYENQQIEDTSKNCFNVSNP